MNTSFFYYLYHPFTQSPGQEYEHIRPATKTQHKITYAAFGSFDLSSTIALSSFSKKTRQIVPAATILPVGLSYEVTETVPDYYIQISAEGNIGKITGKETAEAVFTNHKPIGNLIAEKAFEGENPNSDQEFDFTVTIGDSNVSGAFGDMTFSNGIAKFSLKAGESKKATGISANVTYTVKKTDTAGYELVDQQG